MKKPLVWMLAVAVIFLSGVGVFFFVISPRIKQTLGGAAVDEWVARQVTRIANAYLVPEIQFDSFEYSHPGVLEMKGMRLVAPDSGKTKVVEARLMRVTLAEVPTFGQPVVIERIDLEGAALRLLRDPATGGFKALVPFVKGENLKDQGRVDAQVQLSTVFKIKKLTLKDGELLYNDGAGPEMMTLKGVNLDLDAEPDTAAGPGWYSVKFDFDRAPVFAVKADAKVNVDTLEAEFRPLSLAVTLNDEGYGALPPELQRPLKERDARGEMSLVVDGRLSLRDFGASTLKVAASLNAFNFAAGEYRVPIDNAQAEFALAAGVATFSKCEAQMLTGTVRAEGLTLGIADSAKAMSMSWNASGLELRELLRTKTSDGQPPKLAGKLNSSGSLRGSLASLPGSLNGSGNLTVREGRLMSIPVLTDLMETMDVLSKVTGSGAASMTDEADVEFDLTGEGVNITKGTAVTPAAHARFTGLVRYDLTLDLLANAGPMEKVQGLLGKVGGIIGEVTDKLVKYRITGPASDPQIEVKPLGF